MVNMTSVLAYYSLCLIIYNNKIKHKTALKPQNMSNTKNDNIHT